jgi:hypothetical protein
VSGAHVGARSRHRRGPRRRAGGAHRRWRGRHWALAVCTISVEASRRAKALPPTAVGIIGAINASGFLFASHSFEISRIGGIRLLRAQSASCIVHCTVPVVCAPISHQRLEPALTPEDSLLTWDDDLRGSIRRLVASPMGYSSFADGDKRLTGSARCSAIRSALPGIALVLCPSNA